MSAVSRGTSLKLLFATGNENKLRELVQILSPIGVEVVGLDSLECGVVEPIEDGLTFEDNARIKARSYAAQTGVRCLAEDSGLSVEALGGRPGVHSARYSGLTLPRNELDEANNQKLLREMEAVPTQRRGARFVCAMCVASPDGSILAQAQGEFVGRIALAPSGSNGFGYDPLFFVEDCGRTSAQLSPAEKHARSHRGQAARALAVSLTALGLGDE